MKKIFPLNIGQNPYPIIEDGQEYTKTLNYYSAIIVEELKRLLPDNYKSGVSGPNYLVNFRNLANEIAKIQLSAQEIFGDSDYDFTRSEFLHGIIGSLIFTKRNFNEIPKIGGDITYREFLKKMVMLILRGSKKDTLVEAIGLLTDSDIEIIEKSLVDDKSFWDSKHQFSFEINITTGGGTRFPVDPFVLKNNIYLVLKVLKPAHSIYDYRYLFTDAFVCFDDSSFESNYYNFFYDNARHYCSGIKNITSNNGITLKNRRMFSDTSLSFDSVIPNSILEIESGPNKGLYRVLHTLVFPHPDPGNQVGFRCIPSGLSGELIVIGDDVESILSNKWPFPPRPDFSVIGENEVIEITDGPNLGFYRPKCFLGENSGTIDKTPPGPVYNLRMSKCILYLDRKMNFEADNQSYKLSVDMMGMKEVKSVYSEDVSIQFLL